MAAVGDSFGIGAQVFVRDASAADTAPWPQYPSGIILRTAGSALSGVWGRAAGRLWLVEFDAPQINADGTGPFATAQVHEKYLELAPAIDDDPSLGDFPAH